MGNLKKLKNKIASLPDAPGAYLMKDASGEVIYIGKAKSLKKRLSSYLVKDVSSKTIVLLSHVADIEYKLTATESLALLLEASLVHQYKPRYNVSLRDDKSFPLVEINAEKFPALFLTRKKQNNGAQYFGPYTSARLIREALKIIRGYFPYRSCKHLPKRPCIYYQLELCPAPCIKKINKEEYAKTLRNISLILEGKTETLVERLFCSMNLKSKEQKFEEAAKIRDQIIALSGLGSKQGNFYYQNELEDLKKVLKLKCLPERIEAFDISNIKGQEAGGSMVSFYRGVADKNNYRRFRIKTVEGIDDYKMLSEIVKRRYLRLIEERLTLPDLILIDGGRAHLLTAQRTLEKLGLNIPLVSIAKEKENLYILGRRSPLRIKEGTKALNLIRRIRNEAHRFAVSYHHILRRKKIIGR